MSDRLLFVQRKEWKWALCVSLCVLALTWFPYVFGFAICPEGKKFLWLIGNPDDQNVHLMWARQAADGAWRFHDLYTTEPHPGLFVNAFSLLLGWFSRWFHIPLHLAYQIARSLSVIALCTVAYGFGALFFDSIRSRKLFLLLLCLSSGFGWIPLLWLTLSGHSELMSSGSHAAVPLPPFLLDVSPTLMMPEAVTFPSMCVAPLSAIGVTLALLTIGLLIAFLRQPKPLFIIGSGLACAGVANIHSYLLGWLGLVLLCVLLDEALRLRQWRSASRLLWSVGTLSAFAAPALLLQFYTFAADSVFREKALTKTYLPSFWVLTLSYGFVGLLALLGILYVVLIVFFFFIIRSRITNKRRPLAVAPVPFSASRLPHSALRYWLLALAWVISIVLLLHMPISFQRKMAEGLHVPLCLFAVLFFERFLFPRSLRLTAKCSRLVTLTLTLTLSLRGRGEAMRHLRLSTVKRAWILSAIALILLTVPSNVGFILLNLHWLIHNNQPLPPFIPSERVMMPPYFLSESTLDVLHWMREHCQQRSVVLCSPQIGNYVPPLTGCVVFIGHWAETLRFVPKLQIAHRFLSGRMSEEETRAFLSQNRIQYVLLTDYERAMYTYSYPLQGDEVERRLNRWGKVVFQSESDVLYQLSTE